MTKAARTEPEPAASGGAATVAEVVEEATEAIEDAVRRAKDDVRVVNEQLQERSGP
jgi:hypothetical protein